MSLWVGAFFYLVGVEVVSQAVCAGGQPLQGGGGYERDGVQPCAHGVLQTVRESSC
jgi:hypothetical protein